MLFGMTMVVFSWPVTTMLRVYGMDTQPPDPGWGQEAKNNNVYGTTKLTIEDYFL